MEVSTISNIPDVDLAKIEYENKNDIANVLEELLQLSKLLEEWNANNTKLYQEIMKKSVIKSKNQSSNSLLTTFHEILLKMYTIKANVLTKINNIKCQNKDEIVLLSDIFESSNSIIEMFEKEYSLKEMIIADILNRMLRKDEIETNYSLISNEPYIDYENVTAILKDKTAIYQSLIQ